MLRVLLTAFSEGEQCAGESAPSASIKRWGLGRQLSWTQWGCWQLLTGRAMLPLTLSCTQCLLILECNLRLHSTCRCIYTICQHPEVEAKVAAELDVLGLLATPDRPQPRCMEHADLSRLTYLQCIIKVRCCPGISLHCHCGLRLGAVHGVQLAFHFSIHTLLAPC